MSTPNLQCLRRFRSNDEGALIIFGLMLFVLMLMMSGIAVDLMRYENTRTKLQNTLDRCTLAAAALTQTLDRRDVVQDCVQKAGLAKQISDITVVDGGNSSVVRAAGRADTQPMFMHMIGIESLDATGISQAEQSVSNLDIVLVLDISGSMAGTKIANLKVAARDFVDTVLAGDTNHNVSISIVPYNAQVNIGPDLVGAFNVTHQNGVANTNCIEIPTTEGAHLALSRTNALPMMAHADISSSTTRSTSYVAPSSATPSFTSSNCKPTTVNIIRLPGNDADTLKAQISGLQEGGFTSITLGMKWGVTMLDPSMRSAFNSLIGQNKIPVSLANRPFDYTDAGMKIIVLMTDGEHVSHDRVTDAFKSGPSGIFLGSDGRYSVRHTAGRPAAAGSNEYFLPHLATSPVADQWQSTPWASGVEQDWRDIWADLRMTYVAWQFHARALGTDTATRNAIYAAMTEAMVATYSVVPAMDTSLDQTCDLAKAQNILVYGIAVAAPDNGQAVIRSCATSNSHYFEADADGISAAFQAIAGNLTMLKLTQ